MVNVNTLQPIYCAKVMTSQLLKRPQRSAMVAVASVAAEQPIPGALTYSCTKIFADYLAQGLYYEFGKKGIDVLSWKPAGVATKMLKKPAGGGVLSPDVAVRGMLRDLGRDGRTYGKWRHAMSGFGVSIAPLSLLHGFILKKV